MCREAKLKTLNTILKDEKYRGKATSRRDLFEEPNAKQDEDIDSNDEFEDETADNDLPQDGDLDEGSPIELCDQNESGTEDTNLPSGSSGSEEMDDEAEEDQADRRDKIRQLLAQETKCPSAAGFC
jgi:protein AATF/BFR2